MTTATSVLEESLVDSLTSAFDAAPPDAVPEAMAEALRRFDEAEGLALPDRFRRPGESRYARRLVHRDPERDFIAVAMAWGPGQGTPLHDHGGFWCIEYVLEGELDADLYRLDRESPEGLAHFVRLGHERQRAGDLGVLRPPIEHHVIRNPSARARAVTLHLYGGNLDRCRVFEPRGEDWYLPRERALGYDD